MTKNNNKVWTNGSIGLALSGGGFRAAAFHFGTMDYLYEIDMLGQLKLLSTVSGGTFTGVKYTLSKIEGQNYNEYFLSFYNFLQGTNLIEKGLEQLYARDTKASSGKYNISISMAQVYANTFLKKRWNVQIKESPNSKERKNLIENFKRSVLNSNGSCELLIIEINSQRWSISGVNLENELSTIELSKPLIKNYKKLLIELTKKYNSELRNSTIDNENKIIKYAVLSLINSTNIKKYKLQYKTVSTNKEKIELISQFQLKLLSDKNIFDILVVGVNGEKWSISGFDNEFRTIELTDSLIGYYNNLLKELTKNRNKDKIIKLSSSFLSISNKKYSIEYNIISSNDAKEKILNRFKNSFDIDREEHKLLIMGAEDGQETNWSVSGFNKKNVFKHINNNELYKELNKNNDVINNIIKFAILSLNREENEPYYFGDILNTKIDLHQVVFNATEFNQGLAFRFQSSKQVSKIGNDSFEISHKDAEKIRMADIVTASSCFPGGFEPFSFPSDFVWPQNKVPENLKTDEIALMDGGIYDNQGIHSLLHTQENNINDLDIFIISDVDQSPGCDLKIIPAPDNDKKKEIIKIFKTEFEPQKKVCAILLVSVISNGIREWTISGLDDEGKFKTVLIGHANNELLKELNKVQVSRDKIIELALPCLGSKQLFPKLYKFPDWHKKPGILFKILKYINPKKLQLIGSGVIILQIGLLWIISNTLTEKWTSSDFFMTISKIEWNNAVNLSSFKINLDLLLYSFAFIEGVFLIWLLIYINYKVTKTIRAIPMIGGHAWGLLKKIPISEFIEMVDLRIGSLNAMASTIFMKRIRSLSYAKIKGDDHEKIKEVINSVYGKKRILNQIHDLQSDQPFMDLPEIERPSKRLQIAIDSAAKTPTTLWFDRTEIKEISSVIISGQATICYNLMRYIVDVFGNNPKKYPEDVFILWNRLFEDWNHFNEDCRFLLKKRKVFD